MLSSERSPVLGSRQIVDAYESVPDERIVARVQAGETPLFEVIMRRHNQRVYRTVRSIVRDDGETQDVMQEAYLRAYAHLGDFEGRASFRTWLTRIAVNEALGRLRRGRRSEALDHPDEEMHVMASTTNGPEQRASDEELRRILEDAVDRLPADFRSVFVLRDVEQMSIAETAAVLGIPGGTVKTRLHRARQLLRDMVSDRVGAAVPSVYAFHLTRCDVVVDGVLSRLEPP